MERLTHCPQCKHKTTALHCASRMCVWLHCMYCHLFANSSGVMISTGAGKNH